MYNRKLNFITETQFIATVLYFTTQAEIHSTKSARDLSLLHSKYWTLLYKNFTTSTQLHTSNRTQALYKLNLTAQSQILCTSWTSQHKLIFIVGSELKLTAHTGPTVYAEQQMQVEFPFCPLLDII